VTDVPEELVPIKKQALFALPLAVGLLASGCGGNATDSSSSAGTNAPGITAKEVKIGFTGPLTGIAGLAGQGITAGMQIAADQINSSGGINGRKIKLILDDDAYESPRLVANVRRLVSQDKVYALVAPAGSQALPGTWAFIAEQNTPVWGPISPTDPKMQQVYNLAATRTAQDEVAVDHFADQGKKRLAIIAVDSDTGQGGLDAVHNQVPKHPGMKLVSEAKVETGSTNVSSAVLQTLKAKPDALVIATSNLQVALILKQLRSQGSNIPVMADQGAAGTGGSSATGPAGSAAEGLIGGLQVALPTDDIPEVKTWLALAQKSAMPQAVSSFSIQGYGYLQTFAEVLKRAGKDVSYANFYKEADKLATNPVDVKVMPAVKCGPIPTGHTCSNSAALAVFKGGKWEPLLPFTDPK
jgi:branched-chain amino acid transport system substrate-binding protein